MSSLRLNRFSRPEIFALIRPELLRRFLEPCQSYFRRKGIDLSDLRHDTGLKILSRLSDVFLTPTPDIPSALVDTLFCIHEVAVPGNADVLEDIAASEGILLDADSTLLEIALALWMAAPDAMKALHRRQATTRMRRFEFFTAAEGASSALRMNKERLWQLERSLSLYFEKKGRGYGCRIHRSVHGHEHWFFISHGERYRREAIWDEGRPGTVGFRPEKYDLIIYDERTGELRINARSSAQREHYRKLFGFYLFGQENYFPGRSKYTLEPLLRDGFGALLTDDIPEIEWVCLSELSYVVDDGAPEVRTHKANDVFVVLERHGQKIPENARLLKASFRLGFSGQGRPRTLTVRPLNIALYTRDDDGQIVECWLRRRGFIVPEKVSGYEQFEYVLEVS